MSTYRPEGLQNLPIPTPGGPAPGRGAGKFFRPCVSNAMNSTIWWLIWEVSGDSSPGRRLPWALLTAPGRLPFCPGWESRCVSRCWASPPTAPSCSPWRAAQAEALDYFLEHLRPGDILPSVVQNPASFGTFCDIGCGVTALMSIERCSVSRITHCNQRFSPGQKIYTAILGIDREAKRISLTHQGSSWVPGPRMPPDSEPDRPSPASYGAFSPMAHS